MTRLVLHTGTPVTKGRAIRQQLVAARESLEAGGLALPASDRLTSWDTVVDTLIEGGDTPSLESLVREDARRDLATVLVSSDAAYRSLRKPKNVRGLHTYCADNGAECTVVLVVREQLDLLNALYCQQVLAMETYAGFERFVTKAVDSGLYHYAQGFRALLDAEDVDLVAVPYSRLDSSRAARTILDAANVAPDLASVISDPTRQSTPVSRDRLPGPVLVGAARLLHKRLTRLGVDKKSRRPALHKMATALREHAIAYQWDDAEFWGWTADLQASVANTFRFENAEFAAGAWHADWPDAPVMRPPTRVDLASTSPTRVADIVDTIQRVIDEHLPALSKQARRA